MMSTATSGSTWSCWLSPLLDCWSPNQHDAHRVLRRPGVEREMKICHNQPHLIPPMKLVVYEDLPPTPAPPIPSHLSQFVTQGRQLASRASHRASSSIWRKPPSRPSISGPQVVQSSDDLPFRRRHSFRPLELSIYLPENRLSDLPEFEGVDFNAFGEMQLLTKPPKALARSKSQALPTTSPRSPKSRHPTTSMVGERQLDYWQIQRASSVVSTSRPPSAHDTFHSHPVGWSSLPGLAPQPLQRPAELVTILSPMQEEFSPVSEARSPANIGTRASTSSDVQRLIVPEVGSEGRLGSAIQHPFNLGRPPTSHSYRSRSRSQTQSSSIARNRLSQWLSRSSATTAATSTPALSSQSHEPARAYQQAITPSPASSIQAENLTSPSLTTPPPHPMPPLHSRTRTVSASTFASTTADSFTSLTTASTAPTIVHDVSSHTPHSTRTPTIRSYSGSSGITGVKKVFIVERGLENNTCVCRSACNVDVQQADDIVPIVDTSDQEHDVLLIQEMGVRVRSPGIGLAF